MRLLLSMGLKPGGDPSAPLRPALRWLDVDTGEVSTALTEAPDAAVHPSPGDHAEFTGAHRVGDHLVQATRTEVVTLSWPDLAVHRRFSHPLMHDVHDALPLPDGRLAVTATGHDSVLVFDADRLVAHHWLGEHGTFAERHGHVQDWRTVPFDTTKPHDAHPNHLTWWDGALWVTCLHTQRIVCLDEPGRSLAIPEGPPHDGVVDGDLWWVTTVDGQVLGIDVVTGQRRHHLRPDHGGPAGLPGWCRGVTRVGDRLFVGFTTLRASRHKEWARQALRGAAGRKRPTRVVEVDLDSGEVVAEYPVGNEAGGTVYTLIPDGTEADRGR